MSQSNLEKFLMEDKLRNASDKELFDLVFEVECRCMEPKSKHYNTFQTVTRMLIQKYDGMWENFVAADPDAVKEVILKFG